MKPKLKSLLNNNWTVTIIGGLIVGVTLIITDVILKKNWLGKGWQQLNTLFSKTVAVSIWGILAFILGVALLVIVVRWIWNRFFNRDWNTRIGDYTFRELYDIMKTEYIITQPSPMRWKGLDTAEFSVLEWFMGTHTILSEGVNFDTPMNDVGRFCYNLLCPKLHLYGLMDKEDDTVEYSDLVSYSYSINENGKRFWNMLQKVSLKERRNDFKKGIKRDGK